MIGISYFWMLGALFQLDLLLYGTEVLKVGDTQVGLLVTSLAVGIGAGSILAGKISGDRVDLGLVPAGSAAMGLMCLMLYWARFSYAWSIVSLVGLGLASGLFIVPLNAYLQYRSGHKEKGRVLATNNFYNTFGLLIASGVLWLFHDKMHVSSATLVLGAGLTTILATIYVVWLMPDQWIRLLLRIMLHTLFKLRYEGAEQIPARGGALLVSNHMSYLDGFLVGAATERRIRFMVWKPFFDHPVWGWFLRSLKAIPVTDGLKGVKAAIEGARRELEAGHLVCIFAEGAITRTGGLLPFKRGMERMVGGLDVPVIPVHLDRLWGSIFSFKGEKFLQKWPEKIPYPVTISFGAPMPSTSDALHVRQAVSELASVALRIARRAAGNPGDAVCADGTEDVVDARDGGFQRQGIDPWTCAYGSAAVCGLGSGEFGSAGKDWHSVAGFGCRGACEPRNHTGRTCASESKLHRGQRDHGVGRGSMQDPCDRIVEGVFREGQA